MIKVKVVSNGSNIKSVNISGHAKYDEPGKDLVCAAVSTVAVGTLNALDELAKDDCLLNMNDEVDIEFIKFTETSQLIIKVMLIQLQTLHEQYADFIEIKQTEVQNEVCP